MSEMSDIISHRAWYILDENKQPIAVEIEVAGPWLDDLANKVVEQTRFEDEKLVSTIFKFLMEKKAHFSPRCIMKVG